MLTGKVVVVTGGAGLLGREFCTAVADNGGRVVVADCFEHAARDVAAGINAVHPGRAEGAQLDITEPPSIKRLIEDVAGRHGRIDALVNNAYPRNANFGRKLEDVTYPDFCENVSMHLGGYFLTTQQFALFFRRQGHGNIITIASIYGIVAPRFEIYRDTEMTMPVEYAVIKSALIHMNQYMMRYFKGCAIRFNCLSPGGILDKQPESFVRHYREHAQTKGMLSPSDLIGGLMFLLSEQSTYVNGQNLVIDDGWVA